MPAGVRIDRAGQRSESRPARSTARCGRPLARARCDTAAGPGPARSGGIAGAPAVVGEHAACAGRPHNAPQAVCTTALRTHALAPSPHRAAATVAAATGAAVPARSGAGRRSGGAQDARARVQPAMGVSQAVQRLVGAAAIVAVLVACAVEPSQACYDCSECNVCYRTPTIPLTCICCSACNGIYCSTCPIPPNYTYLSYTCYVRHAVGRGATPTVD